MIFLVMPLVVMLATGGHKGTRWHHPSRSHPWLAFYMCGGVKTTVVMTGMVLAAFAMLGYAFTLRIPNVMALRAFGASKACSCIVATWVGWGVNM